MMPRGMHQTRQAKQHSSQQWNGKPIISCDNNVLAVTDCFFYLGRGNNNGVHQRQQFWRATIQAPKKEEPAFNPKAPAFNPKAAVFVAKVAEVKEEAPVANPEPAVSVPEVEEVRSEAPIERDLMKKFDLARIALYYRELAEEAAESLPRVESPPTFAASLGASVPPKDEVTNETLLDRLRRMIGEFARTKAGRYRTTSPPSSPSDLVRGTPDLDSRVAVVSGPNGGEHDDLIGSPPSANTVDNDEIILVNNGGEGGKDGAAPDHAERRLFVSNLKKLAIKYNRPIPVFPLRFLREFLKAKADVYLATRAHLEEEIFPDGFTFTVRRDKSRRNSYGSPVRKSSHC